MTKEYIAEIKSKFPIVAITNQLNDLKMLRVLVIGDAIIDEYTFTLPKGRANKDPILSLDFVKTELYAGGILAIANHISGFVNDLQLVTLLGEYERNEDLIKEKLNKNIKLKCFTKKNSPTTLKKRYIDYLRNGKLFKVEHINDKPIPQETEEKIIEYLKAELPNYDLVVLGDFGHGFITDKLAKFLEDNSKFLAANIQTNSSNMGFNYITKYNKLDYLTSNEKEIRLAMFDRFGDFNDLINKLKEKTNFRNILITQGGLGCLYIKENNACSGPAFTNQIKDAVGAGDAVFAITSLLSYKDTNEDLLIFIANCVGAIAANIMGNETHIEKESLIKFIDELK